MKWFRVRVLSTCCHRHEFLSKWIFGDLFSYKQKMVTEDPNLNLMWIFQRNIGAFGVSKLRKILLTFSIMVVKKPYKFMNSKHNTALQYITLHYNGILYKTLHDSTLRYSTIHHTTLYISITWDNNRTPISFTHLYVFSVFLAMIKCNICSCDYEHSKDAHRPHWYVRRSVGEVIVNEFDENGP